ncbi:unnamed protein product [Thelazia callipaeda]|uniref:Hydrolase_4 domain-containing protein n=1 Tax=Thelazia callipaeda TaxID=103827 RepID=A0A0N5CMN8_THECL|nr:unnamed protein product [Thelazia callipaeda]
MAEFDDFGLLAQMARRELIHLLESMPEVKDLAVESCLMRPLDKIASMSILQQHNCLYVQQFLLNADLTWSERSLRRVYIIRPTLAASKRIAEHVLAEPERKYSVIFVPQRLYICEQEFERRGIFGMIEVFELDLPLISIDSHLFSLEHHEFTMATLVDHTFVHLRAVAKSLWQLQSLYGLIPIVYGVGENSAHVNKLMKKLYAELGEPRSSPDQPICHLFLLDRNLDLTTVLLTGLTYESMVHDTFGINCGKVTFGEEVKKRLKGDTKNQLKITSLDNNDPIFSVVRNMHMTAVFPFLSAKAKSLQAGYDKGSNLEQIKDMKEFVSNELRTLHHQHKLLELHICACEVVLEKCKGISDRLVLEHAIVSGNFDANEVLAYLEDCMCTQRDQWQVLMLACLWSITQNGIPTRYYMQFRNQYLHAYGHESLVVLHFLSIQGLLFEHPTPQIPTVQAMISMKSQVTKSSSVSRPTFQFLARRMALLPSDVEPELNLRNPDQMRYVFSGFYTPILCKIVGDTVNNGWNMQEMKTTFGDSVVFCDQNSYTRASRPPDSRIRKAILVYFIGGVTYAEVAALTLLAQNNNLRISSLLSVCFQKPKLFVAKGSRLENLLQQLPCINKVFIPTWWCPFGSLQTIARGLFAYVKYPAFKREIITLNDGGILALDWLEPVNVKSTSPIIVLLPGIAGSSSSSYILHTVWELYEKGFRSVVVNHRGSAGVPLKTAQTNNAAYTCDLKNVIQLINQRFQHSPKVACGFSLGGIVLWNYLAECKIASETGLIGAICISVVFDASASVLSLERFLPSIFFNRSIVVIAKYSLKRYKSLFENKCDWNAVMSSQTLRDFDTAFTVPVAGFRSADDYYHAFSLPSKADRISIPTVCLNAADDCFCPLNSIPFEAVEKNENIAIILTRHGGHVAFMKKAFPCARGLMSTLTTEYICALLS